MFMNLNMMVSRDVINEQEPTKVAIEGIGIVHFPSHNSQESQQKLGIWNYSKIRRLVRNNSFELLNSNSSQEIGQLPLSLHGASSISK